MTSTTIGTINKSESAEVRVTTSNYKGRSVVDVRVWYIPEGSQEYTPSRKGITIDIGKVKDLIHILNRVL